MSLHRIEADLRSLLSEHGREDLIRDAAGRVAYTDDGTTLYVHILPEATWDRLRPGQAYVLAFANKSDLPKLSDHRQLLREARLLLYDDIDDIIRWLDGG